MPTETEAPAKPGRTTRRRFLKFAGASTLAGLGLGVYTWRIEPHWVRVVRRELPIARLPDALIGRTLVQVSDLHVGPVVDPDFLRASLRSIAGLEPALIVITGDLTNDGAPAQVDEVARILEALPDAPLGCLAIPGNHDYGWGWSNLPLLENLGRRLAGIGVRLLRNEMADVGGLQVAGIDDLWSPCFRPGDVLPTLDPERASLVLCHNPDAADLPIWSGYRGWILAGHTHGGQCKPPFLPPPLLPVKNKRYTAGAFEVGEGRRLYINRGLGYLRRVRFNVRPEITAFRLERA